MGAPLRKIIIASLPEEIQDQIYDDSIAQPVRCSSTLGPCSQPPKIIHTKGLDLGGLPTEIRHQIYRDVFHDIYVVPSHSELTFSTQEALPLYAGRHTHEIGLLGACKALRADALDFAYATLTFRVVFPQETDETVLGPCQEIIDRMDKIEMDIEMPYYYLPHLISRNEYIEKRTKLMNIFYSTMLLKLSARETPGVSCRVTFRRIFLEQLPWDKLPFFEALDQVPHYRSVSLKLIPRLHTLLQSPSTFGVRSCVYDGLRDGLACMMEKSMGPSRRWIEEPSRLLEFRPLFNKKTIVKKGLWNRDLEGTGAKEGICEEKSDDENPDERKSTEDDVEGIAIDDGDCFEDWKWRDL